MKTISGYADKICRLECSCCSEDHYMEIGMPRKKYLIDDDISTIKFVDTSAKFWDLETKTRNIWNFLFNFKTYKNSPFNSLIVDYDQISDLYSTLKMEYEQNDILKPEDIDPEFKISAEKVGQFAKDDWPEYFFYRSKDGLSIVAWASRDNSKAIDNIEIGYCVPEEIKFLERFKKSFRFFFKPMRYEHRVFEFYECSLSKEEFVKFMNVLNWILTRLKQSENGMEVCGAEDENHIEWN